MSKKKFQWTFGSVNDWWSKHKLDKTNTPPNPNSINMKKPMGEALKDYMSNFTVGFKINFSGRKNKK